MKKVEQHLIKQNHRWFSECQKLCSDSRKLFNCVQFNQRQSYFYNNGYLNLAKLNLIFKDHELYKLLPAKVSQLVLKQSQDNWFGFYKALESYKKDKTKFTGKPKPPGYSLEYNLVKFNSQAISSKDLKKGLITLSKTSISLPLSPDISELIEVRIVPKVGCFVIEVVYETLKERSIIDNGISAAIDLGLDNLATVVFSNHKQPLIVNGKPLKSANKFYNKQVAKYKGLFKTKETSSKRIQNIIRNRNNFVKTYIHQATRLLTNELIELNVKTISIGKNEQWKTRAKLGKKNNQSFVQIPHSKFIQVLTYKLEELGISVLLTEESYTSKSSYLDWDNIPTYNKEQKTKHKFSGKRISRSWYKSESGRLIHADVNGAYNIGRKSNPEFKRDMGCLVVHPRRITPMFCRSTIK